MLVSLRPSSSGLFRRETLSSCGCHTQSKWSIQSPTIEKKHKKTNKRRDTQRMYVQNTQAFGNEKKKIYIEKKEQEIKKKHIAKLFLPSVKICFWSFAFSFFLSPFFLFFLSDFNLLNGGQLDDRLPSRSEVYTRPPPTARRSSRRSRRFPDTASAARKDTWKSVQSQR